MASKEARERKLKEIQEIAEGWGKMIAREAFPDGPGLDVTLADMEEICRGGFSGSGARGSGVDDRHSGGATGRRGSLPDLWQGMCPLKRKSRPVVCARWRGHPGGTGGPLPDVSSGFFSLSVRC